MESKTIHNELITLHQDTDNNVWFVNTPHFQLFASSSYSEALEYYENIE